MPTTGRLSHFSFEPFGCSISSHSSPWLLNTTDENKTFAGEGGRGQRGHKAAVGLVHLERRAVGDGESRRRRLGGAQRGGSLNAQPQKNGGEVADRPLDELRRAVLDQAFRPREGVDV
jgi:hypothetical protein